MPNEFFDVRVISRGKSGKGGQRGGRSSANAAAYRSGTVVSVLAAATMMMGHSVVASAAYRSGETLYDQHAQKTFDYRAKEDVIHTEIMTPEHAPVWASDRSFLWSQVEITEKRKDAQLARDIIAALPRELNYEQQIALVREFVQEQFVDKGMIADIAIHDKWASDGGRQPHAHIMLTMRDVTKEGFGKKNREWNDRTHVSTWRAAFADTTNRHLEAAGRSERLSLESYAARGIDKVPGEHLGPEAWNLEKKGRETFKGDLNREIEHVNEVNDLVKRYDRRNAPANTDPMLDTMQAEQGRVDAPLLASIMAEQGKATESESDTANGVLQSSHGDAGLDGGAYTDAQLEAMHRASVRQVVRGIMRQSVHAIAEHFERVRRYGQQVMGMTQGLARSVIDHIMREQRRADAAAPQSRDGALMAQARRETERQSRERRREDLER
jgi:hypothetical protein